MRWQLFETSCPEVKGQIHEIDPAEAENLRSSATFLDVREADEYEQGAIPGAIHHPVVSLRFRLRVESLRRLELIVVYCAEAPDLPLPRSLADLGYTDVVSMAGGFNRWKDEAELAGSRCPLPLKQRN